MVYNSRSHSPQYRTKMIKKLIFSAFILLLAPLFHAASAADASKIAKAPLRGDPIAGEGKVMVCASCHGVDGNSELASGQLWQDNGKAICLINLNI